MKQDMIVILDLGSHENTVVARAIRALGVYSEIYPHDITAAELKALPNVKGIIMISFMSWMVSKRLFYNSSFVISFPVHSTTKRLRHPRASSKSLWARGKSLRLEDRPAGRNA